MPSTSSEPGRPIVLAVIALTELVEAGLRNLLVPYGQRVRVADAGSACPYDLGLVDPDLLDDDWQPPQGSPLVALVRDHSARAGLRARDLGVWEVVPLDLPADELVSTLESLHRQGCMTPASRPDSDGGLLTRRESEILVRICQGHTNKQIADELYLSSNSIKSYIRTAYRKMGVSTRSQAVLWGLDHGFG